MTSLRKNQGALQVKVSGDWEYVFCYNGGKIITTKARTKALGKHHLPTFLSKFGNHEFRVQKGTTNKSKKR